MRIVFLLLLGLFVSGCSAPVPPNVVTPARPAIADASVIVEDAETLIAETLNEYVDMTNQIVSGKLPGAAIAELTTPNWAIEEINGFAALDVLDDNPPIVSLSRWQLTAMRGRHSLVDALVSACLGSATTQMHVSIRLVPFDGAVVIDEISPREDSTWCSVSSSP